MAGRIWVDVEDLFEYARVNPRPSGIQRLAYEIYCNLQERYAETGLISFVRNVHGPAGFQVVAWSEIETLFSDLTAEHVKPAQSHPALPPVGIPPISPARKLLRKLAYRLPPPVRDSIIDVRTAQYRAFRAWGKLIGTILQETNRTKASFLRGLGGPARTRTPAEAAPSCHQTSKALTDVDETACPSASSPNDFARLSGPGDTLLILGSPWSHPDYAALLRSQRARGLRVALLIYDLIPLRRPEWCDRGLVRLFRSWYDSVFPLCDILFAISHATAKDIEVYARSRSIDIPSRVIPIPIGTGFGKTAQAAIPVRRRNLPAPGSYALIVSTIEARKNHILLFRIWRRLLEELPHEQIPTLIFAGRVGWLVDDLMRQIANTNNLDGKLVLIENPPDDDLVTLYRGCLFTLFPSLYEGWGLPVTESLALGKPCFISNRTSLPEAGGALARAFDPDNLDEAYQMVRTVIEDRVDLERWEAKVRQEFEPVSWSASADAILSALWAEVGLAGSISAD